MSSIRTRVSQDDNPRLPSGPRIEVKELLANGEERCEVRWPTGVEMTDSPVSDWSQVRDVDLEIDSVTGDFVLSFTRKNAARARRWT
jgi:hypothetical protein